MTRYILALDQGTTSSRAILFDRNGRICGSAQLELRQIFPQPGWVEHDADEIWQIQLSVAQAVLRNHAISGVDVLAIGIANQRETSVVWDCKSGAPIAHAIVWQDRRTADSCAGLGAAYLAGLALKFWTSREEIAAQWQAEHYFIPSMSEEARAALRSQWQRATERAKHWIEP